MSSFWFGLIFGGALPIVAGTLLGLYLIRRWPG